jgi:hypothetical protein
LKCPFAAGGVHERKQHQQQELPAASAALHVLPSTVTFSFIQIAGVLTISGTVIAIVTSFTAAFQQG